MGDHAKTGQWYIKLYVSPHAHGLASRLLLQVSIPLLIPFTPYPIHSPILALFSLHPTYNSPPSLPYTLQRGEECPRPGRPPTGHLLCGYSKGHHDVPPSTPSPSAGGAHGFVQCHARIPPSLWISYPSRHGTDAGLGARAYYLLHMSAFVRL